MCDWGHLVNLVVGWRFWPTLASGKCPPQHTEPGWSCFTSMAVADWAGVEPDPGSGSKGHQF